MELFDHNGHLLPSVDLLEAREGLSADKLAQLDDLIDAARNMELAEAEHEEAVKAVGLAEEHVAQVRADTPPPLSHTENIKQWIESQRRAALGQ